MPDVISSFSGQFEALSNFFRSPMYCQIGNWGVYWVETAEHAYQANKATEFEDALFILNAYTPGQAKRRGSKITLRPDWEEVKYRIMWDILLTKFSYGKMADMLKGTGDSIMVEGNHWHDNTWGSCHCPKCKGTPVHNATTWPPQNNALGIMLMEIRRLLQKGEMEWLSNSNFCECAQKTFDQLVSSSLNSISHHPLPPLLSVLTTDTGSQP